MLQPFVCGQVSSGATSVPDATTQVARRASLVGASVKVLGNATDLHTAHSRIDGVGNYRLGKVAGVADVPLHGVFFLWRVRLATVLTKRPTDVEIISGYLKKNQSGASRVIRPVSGAPPAIPFVTTL